jgi:hypothetical protein
MYSEPFRPIATSQGFASFASVAGPPSPPNPFSPVPATTRMAPSGGNASTLFRRVSTT